MIHYGRCRDKLLTYERSTEASTADYKASLRLLGGCKDPVCSVWLLTLATVKFDIQSPRSTIHWFDLGVLLFQIGPAQWLFDANEGASDALDT